VRRGVPPPAALVLGALVIGGSVVMVLAAVAAVLFFLVAAALPVILFAGAVALIVRHTSRRAPVQRWEPRMMSPPMRPVAPPRPGVVWSRARARFVTLRSEYASYECDPMNVLRLPALADVTVPSTARFVEAFAEAQALETEAFPPGQHASAFVAAVDRAERAWQAARDAAERIRLSRLSPAERGAVERVIKLLTTARDSDNDAERLTAYARARSELARLDRAGVIHMPRTAQAALEVAGRGQLPA
jgi:hypothetical protein